MQNGALSIVVAVDPALSSGFEAGIPAHRNWRTLLIAVRRHCACSRHSCFTSLSFRTMRHERDVAGTKVLLPPDNNEGTLGLGRPVIGCDLSSPGVRADRDMKTGGTVG